MTNPTAAPGVFWRLSVLMALQWGALGMWIVTLPTYLAANTGSQGLGIFGPSFIGDVGIASALGALLSPFVFGMLVDRFFRTEQVAAVLSLLCALLAWTLSETRTQAAFFGVIVLYFQASAPMSSLLSSMAMRHLPDPARGFPQVRAAGTFGWVLSGCVIGLWPVVMSESIEATTVPMKLAAACHVITALYCLTMPPTRPLQTGGLSRLLGGGLWRNRRAMLFLGVSVLAATPSKFYEGFINQYLNYYEYSYPAFVQSIGQACEVGAMLLAPLLLARFRLKTLFTVGMLCWIARFVLLAAADGAGHPWMVYTGMGLHGFCYVLVFILGQMYIDRLAPADARGAAQGMHVLAMLGLGAMIGAKLSGWAQAVWLTPDGVTPAPYHWPAFWMASCAISVLALVVFLAFFREEKDPVRPATTTACDPASDN